MHAWLVAIAAASVSGQPVQIPVAPPPKPHLHYEIRIERNEARPPPMPKILSKPALCPRASPADSTERKKATRLCNSIS